MDLPGYLIGLLHVRFQILMVLFCMVSVGYIYLHNLLVLCPFCIVASF